MIQINIQDSKRKYKFILLFYVTGPLALQISPHERGSFLELINIIPIESFEETIKSSELTSAAASEELYQQICAKKSIKN